VRHRAARGGNNPLSFLPEHGPSGYGAVMPADGGSSSTAARHRVIDIDVWRGDDPEVGGRSRHGTVFDDLLVEEVGAVEGGLEVGAVLEFAHLDHINPGPIWQHLDRLAARLAGREPA
jgi:hypothetical protein